LILERTIHISVRCEGYDDLRLEILDTDSCYGIKTAFVERLKRISPDRVVHPCEITLRHPDETLLQDRDSVRHLDSMVLIASVEESLTVTFRYNEKLLIHPFDVKKTVADMKAYLAGEIGAQIEDIRLDLHGRNLNDALAVSGLRIRPGSQIIVYDGQIDGTGMLLLSGTLPEPVAIDFRYEGNLATVRFPTCTTVADAKAHLALHVFYIAQEVAFSLWFQGIRLDDAVILADVKVPAQAHIDVITHGVTHRSQQYSPSRHAPPPSTPLVAYPLGLEQS
jgi:hypothetical protein